jgi:hypothetical protein
MRQILLKPTATLSRRATEEMVQLVAQATVDPGGTILRATRTGCDWWTYAGLKGNAALAYRHALPATFDSITIHARCSPAELSRRLETQPTLASSGPDPHFRPKFAECISDHLLGMFVWERIYDWNAASHIEQLEIITHRPAVG